MGKVGDVSHISSDRLVDLAFVLHAIDKTSPLTGLKKLQGTMFLVELDLKRQGLTGPRFTFVQSSQGPLSKDLWTAFEELSVRGFIDSTRMSLTDRGKFLLDLIVPELRAVRDNEPVFAIVDAVLKRCQPQSADSIFENINELSLQAEGELELVHVKDIPANKTLIAPPKGWVKLPEDLPALVEQELALSKEEIEQTEVDWPLIQQRALNRLRRAMNDDQPI